MSGGYIPALRFGFLTRFYDPVVAISSREGTFKRRVLERAGLRDGDRVLDLACGTGTLAIRAKRETPGASLTGVDGDPEVLERARAKAARAGAEVDFDTGLSTELPYPDGSFDAVLSTLFFHHLTDADKLRSAREARRVLRPGGRLVVADWGRPQDPVMRAAFFGVQLLDGFETTAASVAGRLQAILADAGLAGVTVTDRLRAPAGTVEIVSARRG